MSAGPSRVPPPLPRLNGSIVHIAIAGTIAYFTAFLVLLFFLDQLRANDALIWLWTCLAGGILGLVGLAIFSWQRSAARKGRRGAQTGLLE